MLKNRNRTALIWAATLAAALGPFSALNAQEGDGMGLSEGQTNRVVQLLESGFDTCSKVEVLYRADCFQQVYRSGAKVLSNNAGYWEAEVALTRVGRNLYSFVRANTDSSADRIRSGGFRLKAITQESLPQAVDIYRKNVALAGQVLRSGSPAEQKYFEPIADLVDEHLAAIPK